MKVIISTVGTSMLNTFRRDPELGPIIQTLQECRPEQLNEYKEEYERLYRELVRTGTAESFDPVTFSAETNSLFRMQVKKGDRVEFLVSDTLDGLVCGKALDRICAARWELEAECRVIDGLQVKDSKEFRRTGLNTLVDTLESILNRYDPRAYEVIVNPTGGFKAVVPYLTLFGLIHAIPVRYIYERSDSLIELPSAPLSLNVDSLYRLGVQAVKQLATDYVALDELSRLSGYSVYKLQTDFSDILVFEEELCTLTALARLLYFREMYREGSDRILLSHTVRKKLKQNPSLKQELEWVFERMRNPLFRTHHLHNEIQNERIDLDCLKRRRTSERIFFFVQENDVYVCDVFMHDEYERILKNETLLKKQYVRDFDEPVRIR